jgi:hypothetical protein
MNEKKWDGIRWEYQLQFFSPEQYQNGVAKLNELGREGWEVINSHFHNAYEIQEFVVLLKRPIMPGAE